MAWLFALALAMAQPRFDAPRDPAITYKEHERVLEGYAAGDFAQMDAWLKILANGSPSTMPQFATAIETAGPKWIGRGAGETRDRRRLIVAAVAVEAANHGGGTNWPEARDFLEWACALVRKNSRPSAAELTFHRAATAVFEGAADAPVLQAHTAHALKRFPDDHRLILARAIAAELRTWPDPRDGRTPRERSADGVGLAIARLNGARQFEELRAEAALHLGFMAIRNGDAAEALPYLREAESTNHDTFILHLVQLFRGRALERLNRTDEAISAYRAALAAEPGQTAQLALASALARTGRPQDAIRVAAGATTSSWDRVDPWVAYGRGDARMWLTIVAQLRRELARP
jgi:hypothetical protein